MKRLLYCVQRYRPAYEATSKEIDLLANHFSGHIHDLHLDGVFRFTFTSSLTSYHALFYPLLYFPFRLFSQRKIIHLYTSLCDRPYLPFLSKSNMVITSPNYFSKERIASKIKYLNAAQNIIVQSEVARKELLEAGINEEKISVIYPPVELHRFSYHAPPKQFTILNASCPGKVRDLHKRGVHFLLDLDKYLSDEQIKFLWRGGEFSLFKDKIKNQSFHHMSVENRIYPDMNEQYAQVHCTIIPYLQFDERLKLIPTSVIESLAAGKPVLVSSKTGVAAIIKSNECGVVFEPTQESLLHAIAELRANYQRYQRNCRGTAERYFSQQQFLEKHKQIYESLR